MIPFAVIESTKSQNILRVAKANTFAERLVGLLATKYLDQTMSLLINPCSDVHTCFMRYHIDIVFLDKDHKVLAVRSNVGSFRFIFGPRCSKSVLELAAGAASAYGIKAGDRLVFKPL